jgi:tetratricopeptide (TPR) repeat protein
LGPDGKPILNLEDEMMALFNDAHSAFNQGKFDVALQKIGAIHTKTNNKDYEMVMFLEGACHFNLKAYDKAVSFFEDFLKKFPESASVNEAKMAIGESYLLAGNPEKGIAALKEAATVDELFEKAGLMIASYYKKEGKPDEALPILEKLVAGLSGAPTQEQQQAILIASEIYLSKGETEKAQGVMEKLSIGANADDTVVQRNTMAQKIGDTMLEQKRYGEALRAYQSVRRQSELLRLQRARVARIEQWVATLSQPNGRVMFLGRLLSKEEAAAMLEQNKSLLAEIEGVKDYDAGLYYRLGQCFYEMQRYYEAMLAFSKIYTDFREYKDRDRCLFGMIVCNAALKRSSRAMDLSEKYMKEFPEGSNYGNVTDMLASLAVESGDSKKAKDILHIALGQKGADKERLNFMLGVVCFEMQDFDEARIAMQAVMEENKKSGFMDSAMYYIALSYFFQNNSVKFLEEANNYLVANPKGDYVVDAKYRMAFIKLQAGKTGQKGGDVGGAREILEGLVTEYPSDANLGQVWSLLGDIYAEANDPEGKIDYEAKTLEAYRNAVDKARTPDVLNYAIDAAQGLMQQKEMWPEIIAMWTTYYNGHAGKPEALKAIHFIASARERLANKLVREGNFDEATKIRGEARALVAKELLPHLGNPANEQVEVLIQQLVTMMVPKKRGHSSAVPASAPAPATGAAKPSGSSSAQAPDPAGKPAAGATATPKPAALEEKNPTPEEVDEEFKKLLSPEGAMPNGTATARVLYGRALIARLFRDVPKYENLISIIPDAAKAEELSPLLLATMGEIMFKQGNSEKAAEYYNQIRSKYPNSEFGDRAPNGLAEIEFQKKDYQAALDLYSEAIDKYAYSEESILTGSLGKGKCYVAMLKWDDAEKLFTTILNTREWRSAHPTALLGLGDVMVGKKDYAKAITYYRKILLAWRKDKTILFQAYLNCAKAYISNTDNKSAREVLEEMLRQKEIGDFPALQSEAQQLLNKTGA